MRDETKQARTDESVTRALPLKSRAKIQRIKEKNQVDKIIKAIKAYLKFKQFPKSNLNHSKAFNPANALIGLTIENESKFTTIYDKKNYFGLRKWSNGSWYSGTFNEGKCNGFGKYNNQYGDILTGIFEMNKVTRYCIYSHSKGGEYEGEWNNNFIEGIGKEKWSDQCSYEGSYVNGAKEGIGTYTWSNKSKYQGEWKENYPHGNGVFYYHDGRQYEGEWKQGKMDGIGLFTWLDGRKYIGSYYNDKLCGFGMFVWSKPNFKIYLGFWNKNKQNGFAKVMTYRHEKYSYWNEGKKITEYLSEDSFFNDLKQNYSKYILFYKMPLEKLIKFCSI